MAVLNLKLLGRIACELGPDSQLTLSTRKAEVLLAYLALAPGVRHPRERLINLLWSDRSEEQARNSLRQALSAIKKTFTDMGVVPLEIDRSTVMLDDNQIHIDALEFEQLAKETNQKQLTKAADIYQGEFLEGINIRDMASQTWLSQQRDRYKRMIVEVLSSLCDLQLKQGQFKSAIETADRLVSFDSLHESGWRMLMKAHHDKGERNHALMAYKRCADVLNHELGVQPEPETIALRDLIRGGTQPETNLDNQELAPQIKHEGKTEKSKTSSNDEARKTGRVFDQSAILVLPFENLSNDSEQQYFSDGITEGVIVGLSMYPSLTILSRNYSFAIQDQKLTIRDIANKYKVQYVIEGSVRKTPEKLRITTQLVNAQTGEQLWGKRFDSKLEHIFSIEDELTRTIVANIQGKIDASDKEIAYRKPAKDMRSYDMLMQGKYHLGKFNPEDNRLGRIILDKCIESDPECAIAYNYLYRIYIADWLSGWTEPRDQMIEKAGEHIKKAVALAPDESIIQASYAEFLLFSRQYQQCEIHAERAFRIDPNDTETLATLSAIHAGLANVELALEMADACRTLDPFHPWIDWVNGIAYYTGKRYQDALATFKMMPNPADEIEGWIAACYERLGNPMDAEKHLHQYVKIVRKNMVTPPVTREDWHKLWQATSDFKHSNDVDHPFDALIAAGLEHYFEESASDTAIKDVHHSFPSIVVLPFDNLSGDPEQEYFSDGITESTILNLSMFNGLIVKSRHSSFAYKNSDKSIQTIAEELNAQYLVEGSIRKSPDKVRITVQLVESGSGNQLWGKRYDADLEDIFELEQELTESIAGTIGGKIGQELRKTAVKKSAKDLKSYDYFLRGMHHGMMFAPKDAVIAKQQFEKCLAIDPEYADAHASLAAMYLLDVVENWTADRQHSLKMANQHARTAIELDSQSALVQAYMAEVLFMHRDFEQGYLHAERVIELNPTLPDGYSYKAWALEGMGQFDEALECADRSLELDPHHSYAGWIAGEVYRDIGDFEKAIKAFRSLPHQPCSVTGQIAACYAGLGQLDRAKAEMQHYHDIARDQMKVYPTTVEQWRSFWYDSMPYKLDKDFDRFFDLLLQAGLCDGLDDIPVDLPSVAVLPFENMSGDPEQEYFSDGITSDIIGTLSRFRNMHVNARHSTLHYKQTKLSISEIAKDQGVRYILAGSVRKSGDKVRVNAQLIDSHTEEICWTDTFDRSLDDIFAVQDEITKNIAVAMKVHLTDGDRAQATVNDTKSIKAWEAMVLAIELSDSYIHDNILKARRLAEEALKLDPEYINAWTILGWTHWQEANCGWSASFDASIDDAEKAVKMALSLDLADPEASCLMGCIHLMRAQPEQAIESCQMAVSQLPGNSEAHGLMGYALNYAGRYEDALTHYDTAIRLSPVSPNWSRTVGGYVHQHTGNIDKAIEIYQLGVKVEPESPLCRYFLMDALMEAGQIEQARRIAREIRELKNSMGVSGIIRGYSYDQAMRERFKNNLNEMGFNS